MDGLVLRDGIFLVLLQGCLHVAFFELESGLFPEALAVFSEQFNIFRQSIGERLVIQKLGFYRGHTSLHLLDAFVDQLPEVLPEVILQLLDIGHHIYAKLALEVF